MLLDKYLKFTRTQLTFIHQKLEQKTNQWGEALISMSLQNRKASMCAGIRGSENLTEGTHIWLCNRSLHCFILGSTFILLLWAYKLSDSTDPHIISQPQNFYLTISSYFRLASNLMFWKQRQMCKDLIGVSFCLKNYVGKPNTPEEKHK